MPEAIRCGQSSGAQRLSASTNESPDLSVAVARAGHVLNAFRHQRMNHTGVATAVDLTGLSAQRLSASTNESPAEIRAKWDVQTVLNAFRHQRMNHLSF